MVPLHPVDEWYRGIVTTLRSTCPLDIVNGLEAAQSIAHLLTIAAIFQKPLTRARIQVCLQGMILRNRQEENLIGSVKKGGGKKSIAIRPTAC